MITTIHNIGLFILYALCSSSGLIILKIAMNNKAPNSLNILDFFLQPKFIIGFVLYAFGFVLWLMIISKFKLNIAFPIATSLFFITLTLGSYFILNEIFPTIHIVGIGFCLIGILLIGI